MVTMITVAMSFLLSGGVMADSAMRREQLLKQTRKRYESAGIPAVHPRYGHIYHGLYEEKPAAAQGSFYLRLAIGIICFVLYVWADFQDISVAGVSSDHVVSQIEEQTDIETIIETWKENVAAK